MNLKNSQEVYKKEYEVIQRWAKWRQTNIDSIFDIHFICLEGFALNRLERIEEAALCLRMTAFVWKGRSKPAEGRAHTEFTQRRILTSALPEMLPVPHLECGFHPCSQPVHRKTWRGTPSCPQPKHTVGRRKENEVKQGHEKKKACCSSSVIWLETTCNVIPPYDEAYTCCTFCSSSLL